MEMQNIAEKIDYVLGDVNISMALDPDVEQYAVKAHVVGYKLDNAMSGGLDEHAMARGYQEFVLVLETYRGDREEPKRAEFDTSPFQDSTSRNSFREVQINMASLIALLRQVDEPRMRLAAKHGPRLAEAVEVIEAIQFITKEARDDMHEPDEQDIGMKVTNGDVYSETDHAKFVLYRGAAKVEFDTPVLLSMMKLAKVSLAPHRLERKLAEAA